MSSRSAKSNPVEALLYDGWEMICCTDISSSISPTCDLSWSPKTTLMEEGDLFGTQCAAVSTHRGWMSVPPQKEKPLPVRRLACHLYSHTVAVWPFTMFTWVPL